MGAIAPVVGQILSADRVVPWKPGIPGGIPHRTTVFANVREAPYGAKGDGIANDTAAIRQAIADCPAGQVVYIPAGTYRITDRLYFPSGRSNITIRGDGPDSTKLNFVNTSYGFWFGIKRFGSYLPVTASAPKGADTVQVASTAGASLAVGGMMLINQLNDGDLVDPINYTGSPVNFSDRDRDGSRCMAQMVRVTAFTATSITFEPPLYYGLSVGLQPEVCAMTSETNNTGIEDLEISDVNGTMSYYAIWFLNAQRCWTRNVRTRNISDYHQFFHWGFQNEVRNCEMVGTKKSPGKSDGFGFRGWNQSALLFEDNIIRDVQWPFILGCGSNGCVVAYNFWHNIQDSVNPGSLTHQIQANHGAHPMFNLYEGNITGKLQANNYHGSCSHMTLFRNVIRGTDVGINRYQIAVSLDGRTKHHSVVGNVLGDPGVAWRHYERNGESFGYFDPAIIRFGYRDMGSNSTASHDPRTKQTTLVHGNYDYATKTVKWDESIAERHLPDSLYLDGKPSWFGSLAWPPVNPSNPVADDPTLIPAGYRFVHGEDPPGTSEDGTSPPRATGQQIFTQVGQAVAVVLGGSDADGDPLTYHLVSLPEHGNLSGNVPVLTYTPAQGFTGSDRFTFKVNDGKHDSSVAIVWITVMPEQVVLGLQFRAVDGEISAPFIASGGVLSQSVLTTDPADGGRAAYRFSVEDPGDYLVLMVVDAADGGSDSLFVNINAEPVAPGMIWAVSPLTSGFEKRWVSWLGSGTASNPEFSPKAFRLDEGEHTLVIRGREPDTKIESIEIVKIPTRPTPNVQVRIGPAAWAGD